MVAPLATLRFSPVVGVNGRSKLADKLESLLRLYFLSYQLNFQMGTYTNVENKQTFRKKADWFEHLQMLIRTQYPIKN